MSPATPSTRDRLVEVAAQLFWEQGYASTGVAQILKSADAHSGSLYHYFPTKEDLLVAVLERYKVILWPAVIQPVFDRVTDPVERIFGVMDGYRQLLQFTDCKKGCPIGNLALELSDSHPGATKLIAENFTGWRNAIRQCVEEAADRFPEDLDRDQLAEFVLVTMEGGVMLARSYKSIEPFESAVAMLRDYFDRILKDGTTWSAPKGAGVAKKAATGRARTPVRRRRT